MNPRQNLPDERVKSFKWKQQFRLEILFRYYERLRKLFEPEMFAFGKPQLVFSFQCIANEISESLEYMINDHNL